MPLFIAIVILGQKCVEIVWQVVTMSPLSLKSLGVAVAAVVTVVVVAWVVVVDSDVIKSWGPWKGASHSN